VTFEQSHDDCFAFNPTSTPLSHPQPRLFVQVHVDDFAANESFVRFNRTSELCESTSLHDEPDPMEHEPCRPLLHMNITRKLIRTDAVFAARNQPHRTEPLV